MKKTLIFLSILLLSVSAFAQVRTGNIYGRVVDPDGNPLPGVSVTLTGQYTAPQTVVSSAEGAFRFLSLPASRDYALKLELTGFKTRIEEGIIIAVGTNANLTLTLEPGVIEEQITVTAVTPVVDTKKTSVGSNLTQELLQELPTARDPWVILQMAPSVVMDRENIGGAESGQQSTYVSRGATDYGNNIWSMDGVVITDPAAIGSSPSYYDFDAFEEMQITVGGADVTVQTGGIAMNMVTRRGGNKMSLGGRFYFTDESFQAEVSQERLDKLGIAGYNKIRKNKDYGFNIGIPIVKDKAWFWGSYGVQDIGTFTVYGNKDDTLLENYAAKLNLQIIPQNRFEAFIHSGAKIKLGRSTSYENPEGLAQGGRFHFGSPILKLQDEHMFGNDLFLSVKFAYGDAGFSLTPMNDLSFVKTPIWDITDERYYGSQASRYYVERPTYQYNFMAQYFNDRLFGASHEFKVGVEYSDRVQYVESVWNGNMMLYQNYNYPIIDTTGDGLPDLPEDDWQYISVWRGYYRDQLVRALAGFVQDTINFGRFTIMLGLRYDVQTPTVNPLTIEAVTDSPAWDFVEASTKAAYDTLLPGVEIPKIKATDIDGNPYKWKVFSPRIGFTWDVTGDGKTIAKLSFSQAGDFMGTGVVDRWSPGGASGWLDFWWLDTGDGILDKSELYWLYRQGAGLDYNAYPVFSGDTFVGDWDDAAGYYWGSYDPENPTATTDPYTQYRANSGSTRMTEVLFTLEREIFTDFAVQLNATYRKYDHFNWSRKYFPATGDLQNQDWYESAGRVPATLEGLGSTGEAADHDWYYTEAPWTNYSPYNINERMPSDRYNDYLGFDLVVNKRLSNKWMLNGSFTYNVSKAHYGDEGYMSATNIWAYEGYDSAAYIGSASGITNQYTNARWMVKLGGLYQFPYDINASFTFQAREGWIINEYFGYVNYTLPNPASRSASLLMVPFGTDRLDPVFNFGIKLEKMLRLGDNGRIYLMLDVFNLFNSDTILRRYQKSYGTYYYYGEGDPANYWKPDANAYRVDGVMNPRVMRLGVRFTF